MYTDNKHEIANSHPYLVSKKVSWPALEKELVH